MFLDPSPKVKEIKATINKWDLIKLKITFTAKETIDKMKRQLTEREKIFANNMNYKWLISKIHTYLNIKKQSFLEIGIFPKGKCMWPIGA